MSESNFKIYVYENFLNEKPTFIGTLYVENKRGKSFSSFEFDDEVVENNLFKNNIFGSDLKLTIGRQYCSSPENLHGIFEDSMPDRWSKMLIDRQYKSQSFTDADYLLKVNDLTRMGGLRFKLDKEGSFLDDTTYAIPPVKRLRELEDAAVKIEDNPSDMSYINLLSPCSSLGGARPKATA